MSDIIWGLGADESKGKKSSRKKPLERRRGKGGLCKMSNLN